MSTIDRPEVSIQISELARFLNLENLHRNFCRMLLNLNTILALCQVSNFLGER